MLQQLRNLREEKSGRGQIGINSCGGKDDTAVALALAVSEAITEKSALPFEIVPENVRPSHASLGLIPGSCRVEAICGNCPACSDVGHCLEFKDLRLYISTTLAVG